MNTTLAILIVVLALIGMAVVAFMATTRRRSQHLQESFGPEYQRALDETGDRKKAEAELEERRRRREKLDIQPLDTGLQEHYLARWHEVQTRFVDVPVQAVAEADALVTEVMSRRGYPMEEFEQRTADISVDHPGVVEDYRTAHAVSLTARENRASTEDLRLAMQHYRSLFEELVQAHQEEKREQKQEAQPSSGRPEVI